MQVRRTRSIISCLLWLFLVSFCSFRGGWAGCPRRHHRAGDVLTVCAGGLGGSSARKAEESCCLKVLFLHFLSGLGVLKMCFWFFAGQGKAKFYLLENSYFLTSLNSALLCSWLVSGSGQHWKVIAVSPNSLAQVLYLEASWFFVLICILFWTFMVNGRTWESPLRGPFPGSKWQ